MKIKLLVATSALLSSTVAHADWFEIGTSSNNSVWMVDFERMKVISGKVQVWVKADHSKDRTINYRQSMRMFSFDCKQSKVRLLSSVTYDSYGKVVSSNTYPDYSYGTGYEPITPESMLEEVSKVACVLDGAN